MNKYDNNIYFAIVKWDGLLSLVVSYYAGENFFPFWYICICTFSARINSATSLTFLFSFIL